jgi:hypothetical protein
MKNAGHPGHVHADGFAGKHPQRISARKRARFVRRVSSVLAVKPIGVVRWSAR